MADKPKPGRTPIPDSAYGSADEESQRVFRITRGTRPGTRLGVGTRPPPRAPKRN